MHGVSDELTMCVCMCACVCICVCVGGVWCGGLAYMYMNTQPV